MGIEDNKWSAGTGRKMRFIAALDPASVVPFDQTTADLLLETKAFAKYVQYFNGQNEPDGDWSGFLGEADLKEMAAFSDDPAAYSGVQKQVYGRPHLALFLSFLNLMKHARKDFNNLPKRHLDYYYREVLHLSRKQAQPDKVHVLLALSDKSGQYLLPGGSRLNAGSDADGKQITYTTDHDIIINNARVTQLKNLYRGGNAIYTSTAPTTITGPQDISVEPVPWTTFGKEIPGNEVSRGLVITSPLLVLKGGTREIDITLRFSGFEEQLHKDLFTDIHVLVSIAGGFLQPNTSVKFKKSAKTQVAVTYHVTLNADSASLAPPEKVIQLPQVALPVIKLVWSDMCDFQDLKLEGVTLKVAVTGLTDLIVADADGVIDISRPFQPFSDDPYLGTQICITHPELVSKKTSSITLNLNWAGAIPDLKDYYKTYTDLDVAAPANKVDPIVADEIGKVTLALAEAGQADTYASVTAPISDIIVLKPSFSGTAEGIGQAEIDTDNLNKYRRLYLTVAGPGFLVEKYIPLESKRALLASQESPTVVTATEAGATTYTVTGLNWTKKILPRPFVPKLKSISLDYEATASWLPDSEQLQLFSLHPFGYTGPHAPEDVQCFTRPNDGEGELYIGIEDVKPSQNLSVLFQLSEGSADPEATAAQMSWSFLQGNKWITATDSSTDVPLVLSDDTNGLQRSGIIQFSIPASVKTDSTLMPPGLLWLRLLVAPTAGLKPGNSRSVASVNDIIAVYTQAVKATFHNNDNSQDHFEQPLPQAAITDLVEVSPQIKEVRQPFTSFGGRAPENDDTFYTRVSERLKHKNRALSIWDYERLVLEQFPGTYKAKCDRAEDVPGLITVTVIPDIRLRFPFAPFEPKAPVTVLREIEDFLKQKTPAYVTIEAKNPNYKIVQLYFDVKFKAGCDPGFYLNVLQEDIRRYLSPWAYEKGAEIEFDQNIYLGPIAYFIDKQPYVDFISGLGIKQIDKDGRPVLPGSASTRDSNSIWVSAREHLISIIDTNVPLHGIGAMRVQYDFTLSKQGAK